jgi:hypothetical protein
MRTLKSKILPLLSRNFATRLAVYIFALSSSACVDRDGTGKEKRSLGGGYTTTSPDAVGTQPEAAITEDQSGSNEKFTKELRQTEFLRDSGRQMTLHQSIGVAARNYDVTRYDLQGQYNWRTHALEAIVSISLTPLVADLDEIILDSGVAAVKSVKTSTGVYLPFSVEEDANIIKIELLPAVRVASGAALTLTIAYESKPGMSLRAIEARKGDPTQSHVVYTTSEPRGAADWMPCNNVPSDRAEFSADFTMPAGESMISNGDLVENDVEGGERHVRYSTRYSLPTYLMAFAIGEFDVSSRQHGSLPVSLWSRRGIPVDSNGVLTELTRQIAALETLLVPFPFEKYAVVMLPDFPAGGIAHAGITFQAENRSTESSLPGDMGLMAHELGHQWFGDYVTVSDWDDLWIKEGMATLLAEEAMRPLEDQNRSGRLFGTNFEIVAGEAMRDTSLPPDDKYTSGPYSRSAWFFTQLRGLTGEKDFWKTLRRILTTHAFGNISSSEIIDAFKPLLKPEVYAKAVAAIDAKAVPQLILVPASENTPVQLSLVETEPSILVPIEIRWQSADGSFVSDFLEANKSITLAPLEGRRLVVDPADIHPDWSNLADKDLYKTLVVPLMTPQTEDDLSSFLQANGSVQSRLLMATNVLPPLKSDNFADFYSRLNSESGKFLALQLACHIAASEPTDAQQNWKPVLAEALQKVPTRGFRVRSRGFSECMQIIGDEQLEVFWNMLAANPQDNGLNETQLQTLALFASKSPRALTAWGAVALEGRWVRTREMAVFQLLKHAEKKLPGYESPDPTDLPQWRAQNAAIIGGSEVYEVLKPALQLARALRSSTSSDSAATNAAIAHTVLASPRAARAHLAGVCTAWILTAGNESSWANFVGIVKASASVLAPEALPALDDPQHNCQRFE